MEGRLAGGWVRGARCARRHPQVTHSRVVRPQGVSSTEQGKGKFEKGKTQTVDCQ
ncbi:hypothetical protein B0T17DRAFT_539671 [Bombardia bombarda]|uniref:Uncharacterized protein n=1 Tax=Bombardia bombarda TaxID=252184 RepID=A0AA39WIE4_9PEZI|nr:hypothetical protein B0T17DRAFT_539671 [Bombardia bombarda]